MRYLGSPCSIPELKWNEQEENVIDALEPSAIIMELLDAAFNVQPFVKLIVVASSWFGIVISAVFNAVTVQVLN